ncbi:hypothetical protein GN244_ATG02787 [Phytophthora infestans]|uniref:RxLR effector protein n=1 Tax=Phytophthora infestans TaxID=4787 RepID=A0A833WLP3_PHYIN|nr:hypothetical protein GN244_ATG02787 [Phytophthora infestans]KAF4138548.1 hypothetical protein GN958_ATG12290 [Phytophthora infestans]
MRLYVLLATVVAATLAVTGNALTESHDDPKITALRGVTATADIATEDSIAERMLTTNELASEEEVEERGRKKRRRRRRRKWFRDNEDEDSDDSDDKKRRRRRRRFWGY